MLRDVYRQSSENPTQYDRLPAGTPELALARYSNNPSDDARFARKRFSGLMLATYVAALFHLGHCTVHAIAPKALFFISTFLLALIVGILIPWAVIRRCFRRVAFALVGAWAFWLHTNFDVPSGFSLLVAASVLGYFSYSFAEHWVFLCTTSPVGRDTAREIREQHMPYLAVLATLPAVFVLLGIAAGQVALALLGVIVLAGYQGCQTMLHWRDCCVSTVLKTWQSWLSYNRTEDRFPGIFQSPSGTADQRLLIAATAGFFLSLPLVRHLVEYPLGLVGITPESRLWIAAACGQANTGLLAWLVELVATVGIPLVLVAVVPVALSMPALYEVAEHAEARIDANNWARVIADITSSADLIERTSVYIGRNIYDGSPLLVPREVFREHGHFLGDSGSGKTSLGLAPLMEQLIADQPCSVVTIDLKADTLELYATARAAGEQWERGTRTPLPLRQFTNESDRSTFAFNPLRQPFFDDLDVYQKTDILCAALGLDYGVDYGEGYYSSANAMVLFETFQRYPDIRSLREAAERVRYFLMHASRHELNPSIRDAGDHVAMVLDRLGAIPALNVTAGEDYPQDILGEAIDLADVFRRPQLLHFHLPCTVAPYTSPEIGRLVASLLLVAGRYVNRSFPVYLVIDEFQRMVGRNLEAMLQLARSMGVGAILANQTMEDLKTSRTNLITAIEANCRFRQCFAVSLSEDRERIITSSGQTVEYVLTFSATTRGDGGSSQSHAMCEQILSRLGINDVLLASDHPHHSIVRITRGKGYAQFGGMACVVESDYHISAEEYSRRRAMPWPSGQRGTFVPRQFKPVSPIASAPAGPVVTTEVVGTTQAESPSPAGTRRSWRKRFGKKPQEGKGKTS